MKKIKETTYPQNIVYDLMKYINDEFTIDFDNPDVEQGIYAAIATLSDRERVILTMRYRHLYTLEKIAREFKISKAYVGRIIDGAHQKLLTPPQKFWIIQGMNGFIVSESERKAEAISRIRIAEEYQRGYSNGYADAVNGRGADSSRKNTLTLNVVDMGFSLHTMNSLLRANLNTLQDLLAFKNHNEIAEIRFLGEKRAKEIAEKIRELGFTESAWEAFLKE